MKKLICLSAAALAACTHNPEPAAQLQNAPQEVTINVATPAIRAMTGGERDASEKESALKVLEFYVFDSAGVPDVEVGRVDASTPGQGYIKSTDENQRTHKIVMAGGANKKIVAVINMDLGAVATYAALKAKMGTWAYTAANSRTEDRSAGFEMTGENTFSVDEGSVNNSVTVSIGRLSSRINAPSFASTVELSSDEIKELWAEKAPELAGKTLCFRAKGWALINGRAKSDALFIGNSDGDDLKKKTIVVNGANVSVPDWNTWSATGKATLASTFNPAGDYTSAYSGPTTSGDFFMNPATEGEKWVYLYENKPDTHLTGWNPASTVAVVIKGAIEVAEDATLNRDRYWRVDLTRDDDFHIYRNTIYDIAVTKVVSPGHGTPEQAEKSDPVVPGKGQTSLDVTIVPRPWRVNEYSTPMR